MISNEQLRALACVEMGAVNIDDLVEINTVPVNTRLPKEQRIMQYIEEIKNPYCFKVGGNVVKTRFSDSGLTLQNALVNTANR